jgi:hypothetical protein
VARNTIGFFNQLRTRETVNVGEGTAVQRIENTVILDYQSFAKGLNVSVPASRLSDGFTPFIQDFDVDDGDLLVRRPGIVQEESFVTAGRTPVEMFVQGNPATGLAELVFIDGPWLGIRGPLGLPTQWFNRALPAGFGWATCIHGGLLILTNGGGASAFYKQPLGTIVTALPWGPARTVMSFAGRVFAGATTDTGALVPMGVQWTGATSEPGDLGPGSGFEELLDDSANGDQIIAMRSLNFDVAAILTRNAVWVAQRTGDSSRPADFSIRSVGYGAVTDASVVRVPGGVAYLSSRDVVVFDGNIVRPISRPINKALYPLNINKLSQYSLNFVESRNVLQVLTPNELFEYSFIFGRWLRHSVKALRSVNTGTQFTSLAGMDVGEFDGGGWGAGWGFSWGRTSSDSGGGSGIRGLDTTIYLKGQFIGRESLTATADFGVPFTPGLETYLQQAQSLDTVVAIKRLIIEFSGAGGVIQWSVPDYNGAWKVTRNTTLPASVRPRSMSFISRSAGLLAGVKISLLSGSVAVGRLQAEVEMRSIDREGGKR